MPAATNSLSCVWHPRRRSIIEIYVSSRPSISRRQFLTIGARCPAAFFASSVRAAVRPIIVELFTSQGCSTCLEADAFMEELRSIAGVIAISLHVDYWDYLGWRDTLGERVYSQRQFDYARRRGDGKVYTPQIVIDGAEHFLGGDRSSVMAAIKRAQMMAPTTWVPITLSSNDEEFAITVEPHGGALDSTLWFMTIAPSIVVKIERGENTGHSVVYHNVVRQLLPAGMWRGGAATFRLPADSVMTSDGKACVALLQVGIVGPVVGVASWGEI